MRSKSSVVASTLLSYDSKPSDAVVSKLLFHLSSLIREFGSPLFGVPVLTGFRAGNTSDPEGQDVGVQCLEAALRVEKVRTAVWSAESKDSDAPKVVEG